MSQEQRKQIAQRQYRIHRDLPVWDLIVLENEGVLNWRFRPKSIDVRVKRAKRHLWKEATVGAAA